MMRHKKGLNLLSHLFKQEEQVLNEKQFQSIRFYHALVHINAQAPPKRKKLKTRVQHLSLVAYLSKS